MNELTYDDLIARVPGWLYAKNRDLVDDMPSIIADAEAEIIMKLDHDLFQAVITGKSMAAGTATLDLTAETPRIMELRAVAVQYRDQTDGWTPLGVRDLHFLQTLYPWGRTGQPRFYSAYGDQRIIKLFPTPHEEIELQLHANVEPLPLGPAQQTNKITKDYSRVLEKACLRHAALYMKNYEDAAEYEKELTNALTEANAAISRKRRDETDQRPRETANAVGV